MSATLSAYNETKQCINALIADSSYRKLGRRYSIPFVTLRDIASGRFNHVSLDTLALVRLRLGLPDIPDYVEVPPCPDCGGVHTGRCHGEPVTAVVVLHPGEQVVGETHNKPHTRKPSKPSVRMARDLVDDIDADKRPGESREDVVRRWKKGMTA